VLPKSGYEIWLEGEGVAVYSGYGASNVANAPRTDWERVGGKGAVFDLRGMDGYTSAYVVEIEGNSVLAPQRHMYEEVFYALEGEGVCEMRASDGTEKIRPWHKGSVIAPPLNCSYRLRNTAAQRALVFAVTDAPLVMDLFHSDSFIHNNPFTFEDRIAAAFNDDEETSAYSDRGILVVEGSHIDAGAVKLGSRSKTGEGTRRAIFGMSGNSLAGHMGQGTVGRYGRAHHHGGGAVILTLQSNGYTLMWPAQFGLRPFETGHGDQVVRIDWEPGAIVSPPTGWFHQHFNIGAEPNRYIAFRFGYGCVFPTRFYANTHDVNGDTACMASTRVGGTMISYDDEDPHIHELYESALRKSGVDCKMDHS